MRLKTLLTIVRMQRKILPKLFLPLILIGYKIVEKFNLMDKGR